MSWEILAILALVLVVLEMLTPFTVFLWMAVGTAAAAAASYYGVAWPGQLGVFLAGTSGSIATYFLRRPRKPGPDVSAPAGILTGLQGVALSEIAPQGRVQVADGSWHARSVDARAIPDGAAIEVTGHDGATLLVRALERPVAPP
ncbi:NfeD family protein [Sediminicoccus sp. KRV36]|uniref:NfeD family protein n=1 Tax=Sediminicoccus sp. KRV36 TaxID=3133721 RepID=UPI00200EA304|nr:NfeD family protein [Sediminicoccus rosea]UPY38985.1 NfeD family protein [Sediminicoccus rosea]